MPDTENSIEELLNAPTHWSLRYGGGIMLVLLALLVLAANYISIKDTKSINGTITNQTDSNHIKIKLADANFFQIKQDNKVNITINAYEPAKYGFVQGTVSTIDTAQGMITVKTVNGARTTKNYTIPYNTPYTCVVKLELAKKGLFEKIVH